MGPRRSKALKASLARRHRRIRAQSEGSHSAKVMDFERASRGCWIAPKGCSRASSVICGWTRATAERIRAESGCKRHSGGVGRDRQPTAQACSGGSADEVGQGVGQRRRENGLAEALAPAGVRRPAAALGSREDVLMDREEQEDEQGLRAADCYERSVHLRGDEPSDGEAVSPCSVVFGQFRKTNSPKLGFRFTILRSSRQVLTAGTICSGGK
jgi:hypothetical protein